MFTYIDSYSAAIKLYSRTFLFVCYVAVVTTQKHCTCSASARACCSTYGNRERRRDNDAQRKRRKKHFVIFAQLVIIFICFIMQKFNAVTTTMAACVTSGNGTPPPPHVHVHKMLSIVARSVGCAVGFSGAYTQQDNIQHRAHAFNTRTCILHSDWAVQGFEKSVANYPIYSFLKTNYFTVSELNLFNLSKYKIILYSKNICLPV